MFKSHLKFNKKQYETNAIIYNLCLTAIFLAMIIVCRFISKYLNFINGYSLQLQYLPLILGLMIIPIFRYRFLLYLISPILLLSFGFSSNPIFDYLFTSWSLWPFLLIRTNWNDSNLVYSSIKIFILFLISFIQMWWWNSLSGVLFFQVDWNYSFVFNAIFNGINFAFLYVFIIYLGYFIFGFQIDNWKLQKMTGNNQACQIKLIHEKLN